MASSERAADADAVSTEETTQVLEFGLGDETYCLDIAYIDEIVDAGDLTAIPNSPRHVEGVMDLRGKTTTIIDPKTLLSVTGSGARERIIVFDPEEVDDGGTVGWVVDEVFQVRDVPADQVDEATTAGDDSVRGIVKGDDRFVVWVEPRTE
ncbi:chemotaxis protein CheW [Halobaculum magnesiiphilum]|uniref:Chemotaxis protein CheW n=1 Tax=Halobaculum magnesiiphilum TaxID=1017351 RepID=A0A8T8W9S7_9EURY|nr:chemotaxis protein CheW [Halobaculum magnesiiphilum]QZP36580.1 chemotaxis protein CheW [Halobaculum magnesiiphilum]